MWTFETPLLPDVQPIVDELARSPHIRCGSLDVCFDVDEPLFVGRAPGRLDLMGGIADYSGSQVLQMPIAEATTVCVQKMTERKLQIVSIGGSRNGDAAGFEINLSELEPDGRPIALDVARRRFAENPKTSWAAYVAGVFVILMNDRRVRFPRGARLLVHSDVPEGKGVSSSAALEVATMKAVAAAFHLELEAREIALLCQTVENRIAGAPCGVMDQMTASCGDNGRLLSLLCQPAQIQPSVPMPPELAVWGIDSGVRHAVSGADYNSVRVGAFMGYRLILEAADIAAREVTASSVRDVRWHGYLANVTPDEFDRLFKHLLPERMSGETFLSRFDAVTDTVTAVEPDRTYAVLHPTAHPVYEHYRVREFARLLRYWTSGNETRLGELMYQSHEGYTACGLGSTATDTLVEMARREGPDQGIFGARITGGGSGGTVALLTAAGAGSLVRSIATEYARRTGQGGYVFSGSSPGAMAFRGWTD